MRSGAVAKKTRLGPMRKLESGPYSRAVSSKKLRIPARNCRMFPAIIVRFGPGGRGDRINALLAKRTVEFSIHDNVSENKPYVVIFCLNRTPSTVRSLGAWMSHVEGAMNGLLGSPSHRDGRNRRAWIRCRAGPHYGSSTPLP